MTMICSRCNQYGIRWMGTWGNLTHTECPNCGGKNCQREDQDDNNEDAEGCDD